MPPSRKSTLESVINTAIDTKLKDVHTMLPGQIINFDPIEQLADIQPQMKRNIDGELLNLPVLSQVPIRFLKSGAFSISFPLTEGDEVGIFILERSIDNWLEDGGIQAPNDIRKFDLSDAYAVPILYSQANKIENFDPDNMVIGNTANDTKITIKPTGEVVIKAIKTTVEGDFDVIGTITAPNIEASDSLIAGTAEVVDHLHGGVTAGTSNTSPLA